MSKQERVLGKGLGDVLKDAGMDSSKLNIMSSIVSSAAGSSERTSEAKGQPRIIGTMAGKIALLKISDLEANPNQPRTDFDGESLSRLAESIERLGVIQPITVRQTRVQKYMIISGERRMRACIEAGLKEIPAYVRQVDDETLLEMALVENMQREDLHPIEVGLTYKRLIMECNQTQEELAARFDIGRSTVANYMRLLKLPEDIQIAVAHREISFGHARALIRFTDSVMQNRAFRAVLEKGISVRQLEQFGTSGENEKKSRGSNAPLGFANQKVLDDLRGRFGSDAKLQSKDDGAGKIVLSYKNARELDRILEKMNL